MKFRSRSPSVLTGACWTMTSFDVDNADDPVALLAFRSPQPSIEGEDRKSLRRHPVPSTTNRSDVILIDVMSTASCHNYFRTHRHSPLAAVINTRRATAISSRMIITSFSQGFPFLLRRCT
ncbi:hypothetical protein Hypma_013417 [Hypsizygus marmoreus]|uniref:Uncharacterized protein n=1 Tax=Hypsizygus marmoreus TaxID=39966 RepID=A0A369JG03_HYPMA|nr:hypothetical protein Hypma_013417 [Hypsizygus marmoreus]